MGGWQEDSVLDLEVWDLGSLPALSGLGDLTGAFLLLNQCGQDLTWKPVDVAKELGGVAWVGVVRAWEQGGAFGAECGVWPKESGS